MSTFYHKNVLETVALYLGFDFLKLEKTNISQLNRGSAERVNSSAIYQPGIADT